MTGCCVLCSKLFLDRITMESDEYYGEPSEFCRLCDGKMKKIDDLVEEYDKIYDDLFRLGLTICNHNLKDHISIISKPDWPTLEEFHFVSIQRLHNILYRGVTPEILGKVSVEAFNPIEGVPAFSDKIHHFFRDVGEPPNGDIGGLLLDNFMDSSYASSIKSKVECPEFSGEFPNQVSYSSTKKVIPQSKYGITSKSKPSSGNGIRTPTASAKSESPQLKLKTKRIRRERLFECPICHKEFRQKRSLDLHFQNHQDKNVTNQCQVCEKTFDTPVLLTMHLSLHQGSFKCTDVCCKKSFESLQLLEEHSIVHNSNTMFDCNFCFQMFNNSDELKLHESDHIQKNQKTFLCEHCGESFPSNFVLADHRKRLHADKLPKFSCPICQKMFQRNTSLITHERTHNGEKPFKCDRCTFSSAQSSALKLHQRIHTGVMPHKCDHCTNHPGFSYKRALLQHLAQIHPDEYLIRKPFLCQVCWKNFETEQELGNHKVEHDKYKCKICDRQFNMLAHLKEHLLRHADIKQFKCQFCLSGTEFTRRKALIVHIRNSHPDEDPERALTCSNSIHVEFKDEPIDT